MKHDKNHLLKKSAPEMNNACFKFNKHSIFYHCLLLSSSSVVLQLLGFSYRILLGRLAGAQAIAVYGLVMSAYNVVLSCTLTGVALSVSRIASSYQALGEGRSIVRLIRVALCLFLGLFCILAVPFGLGRTFFAEKILGNPQSKTALLLIVPCLFLTGFENVHKAFFYGTGQTFPPAVSETLEMLCRIAGALFLFHTANRYLLANDKANLTEGQAAALIVCGMILSEIVSAVFLTTLYRFRSKHLTGKDSVSTVRILQDIASVAVPVSLSTLLGRLISSANMVLIPRALMHAGIGYEAAMEEFGVLSGMTMPMLMLPSAFLSPLITVLSPRFSAEKALEHSAVIRRKAGKAMHIVGLIGIPAMTVMLITGKDLGQLLYKNPKVGEHLPMLAAITLAGFYYAVAESVLESIGLQKRCSVLTVAGSLVGLLCTLVLGGALRLGIWGFLCGELLSALIGSGVCLFWVVKYTGLSLRIRNWVMRPLFASVTAGMFARFILKSLSAKAILPVLSLAFSWSVFFLLYTIFLRLLGTDFWQYTQNTLFLKKISKKAWNNDCQSPKSVL